MELIWLIIIVLVALWLFGFLGRGRWYATGPGITTGTGAGWATGGWIHLLVVLAVILLLCVSSASCNDARGARR